MLKWVLAAFLIVAQFQLQTFQFPNEEVFEERDYQTSNDASMSTSENQKFVSSNNRLRVDEIKEEFSSCACNVTQLLQHPSFVSLKGPKGEPGPQGQDGLIGLPGMPGEQGVSGPMGPQGPPGETGPKGDKGDKGDAGRDGRPGLMGPPGPPGPPGLPSSSRALMQSDIWENGIYSSISSPNSIIRTGPAGPPGPKGDKGDKGEDGFDGLKGERGAVGPPGPPGLAGLPGLDGERGERGPEGPKGAKGEPGTCPMDCSSASFSDRFAMDAATSGFTMIGPKGDKGDRGWPGIPGPKGDKGDRGRRGKRGYPGPPGPSSLGSISKETIKSLINMHGIKGEKGECQRGEQGPPGEPGPPGVVQSEDGLYYKPGPRGPKGEMGRSGLKGDKGDKGDVGPVGPPGPPCNPDSLSGAVMSMPGLPGPPGPPGKGISGPPGPPGPRGFQGLPGPPGPPGPAAKSWVDNNIAYAKDDNRIPNVGMSFSSETSRATEQPVVVPGAVVYSEMDVLLKMSNLHSPGTLAFIQDEQALLVRVRGGWQYVSLGSMIKTNSDVPDIVSNAVHTSTTTAPPFRPPFDLKLSDKSPKTQKKLRMAALNQPYTGDLNGIRDADYECYRQSRKHHFRTTFRAFLASRLQNLNSIVRPQDARLPIVNLKGEILFHSWRDLFTGSSAPFPFSPRIYSFDGRNVLSDSHWPKKLVWHGADSVGQRDVDSYCDAWHSSAMYKFGLASNLLRGKLLEQEKYSCNNAFIVLCIEVGAQAEDSLYRSKRSIDLDQTNNRSASIASLDNLWLV